MQIRFSVQTGNDAPDLNVQPPQAAQPLGFNMPTTIPTPMGWMSYDQIMRVALKIDQVGYKLPNYLAKVMGYPRAFLLSEALQKMVCRSDEPPA
jgi:hypothetical protein